MALRFLLGENLVAPGLELPEAARKASHAAAVEPQRRGRQPLEEAAVVADHDDRRARGLQLRFEPFDGREIEVVRRLVHQQNVGIGAQRAHERGAASFPARQVFRGFLARQADVGEQHAAEVNARILAEARFHIGRDGVEPVEIGLLRQIADRGSPARGALALVRLEHAGGDLE